MYRTVLGLVSCLASTSVLLFVLGEHCTSCPLVVWYRVIHPTYTSFMILIIPLHSYFTHKTIHK